MPLPPVTCPRFQGHLDPSEDIHTYRSSPQASCPYNRRGSYRSALVRHMLRQRPGPATALSCDQVVGNVRMRCGIQVRLGRRGCCAHEEMHRPLPHRASLTSSRRASHEKNRPPRTRRPSTGASGRRRSIRVARAKSGSCPPILRTDPSGRSAGSHGVACVRNAADDQLRWAGPRIRRRWRRERGWRPGRPQPGIETGHQGGVFPSTGLGGTKSSFRLAA